MPNRRIGITRRNDRLYLDAIDLEGMLRARAQQYRTRADGIVAEAADPDYDVDPEARDVVTPLEESLACRMVAEELEQRADALARIG